MQTHIVLDDELVNEALNLTGISNKRELINLALKELVQSRQTKDLFQLAGKLELDKDYDYKAARVMRHDFEGVDVLLDVAEYEPMQEQIEVLRDIHTALGQLNTDQGIEHNKAKDLILSRLAGK